MNGRTSLDKCRTDWKKNRGFALVISLSLMVLLTVLAIGLLGLSSISIRSSSRGDAMAIARANARMAMMFAISELQKEMGPDQRVSATADLGGSADGSRLAAGASPANNIPVGGSSKGLTAVEYGTRYWTGVWENANQNNPGTTIYTRTPTARHRKWLISGNETNLGTNAFTPANKAFALKQDGGVSDSRKAVVLVGKGTAGDPAPDTLDRYVSAPLVEIADDSPSAKNPAGRQAWWIGDEGVKAKLNLSTPFNNQGDATYPSLAAQRRGWEAVDGFASYPTPGGAAADDIPKLVSISQASLINPSLDNGGGAGMGRAFHSATTESFGLLTDTLQGGLRQDLTAYLTQGMPASAPSDILNGVAANANILPAIVTSKNLKGPRWSRLQDFYELGQQAKTAGELTVKPAANLNDMAIAPVIADFRLLLGVKLAFSSASSYRVQPCVKIAVSLANPYPYPLTWGSGLDLEIKNETDPNRLPCRIWEEPDLWATSDQPAYLPQNTSRPAVLNRAIFRIPAGSLPAGQARAYTVGSSITRPANSIAPVVVNLVGMGSVFPDNFNHCVVQDTTNTVNFASNSSLKLDVREDTVTSQATLELRPASSNSILRRIERFELDNAPFAATAHTITAATAAKYVQPMPLQYYGFQLSQPGERYDTLLPSPDQLGLRSSTLRTYADFNLQGTRFRKPIISYNPPPYFMMIADNRGALGNTNGSTGPSFSKDLVMDPLPWGHSHFAPQRTVLFSPPAELVSLAQLQHADLTGDDIYASVGHQPGNALGNSYATPFVPRAKTVHPRMDFTITGFNSATSRMTNYYDMSYLLNAALWDTYFFSTIPDSGAPVPRNPAMVKVDPEDQSSALREATEVAGRLLVNGSHNINCTDKDAWKALLASSKHLKHPAAASSDSNAIFPRSLEQLATGTTPPTGREEDSFAGYRSLTDTELDALAEELARQVRIRGPFVSLSQFVNRSLVSLTQPGIPDARTQGRSGALQSAIDISGVNISPTGSKNPFTAVTLFRDKVNLQPENAGTAVPRADLVGTDTANMPGGPEILWPTRSFDENPGSVAGILADKDMLSKPLFRSEQGYRSTGIPSWLTQADVLQVIGPVISARSDTFRIRAYGEAVDPETGDPVARAWCEAVVQRMPEYVDGSNRVTDRPDDLTPVNRHFGRRFTTVSFKWLSPDEI